MPVAAAYRSFPARSDKARAAAHLLSDQGDLLVGGITPGLAAAGQLILACHGQAGLRVCLAVDLSDVQAY